MTRPSTLALVFAGLASVVAAPSIGAWSRAPQTPVFASRHQAVLVDALVTRGGRPVPGLTAADFDVRDNGVRQTVALLNVENLPINAVLVLDMSGSTAGRRLTDVASATDALLEGLRPIDRAALTTFNDVISPRVPLTTDSRRFVTR